MASLMRPLSESPTRSTSVGDLRCLRVRLFTQAGMVAENSIVCRVSGTPCGGGGGGRAPGQLKHMIIPALHAHHVQRHCTKVFTMCIWSHECPLPLCPRRGSAHPCACCRAGTWRMVSTSSSKPKLSIMSASSRITNFTCARRSGRSERLYLPVRPPATALLRAPPPAHPQLAR